ncbi:MAG TPA: DPP IV N-terminal domain-containing protein [Longimicrobiales bacterium]|nr:DPP IV N-terminal domain-containing protein [Longimicrobiales bacterium]
MRYWLRTGGLLITAVLYATTSQAQDRLKTYPGYAEYQKFVREVPASVRSGAVNVRWADTTHVEYSIAGKRYSYDVRALTATELTTPAQPTPARNLNRERGRQFSEALSPNGSLKAFYKDRNLWLGDATGANAVALTTEGSEKARTKFGVASWVYGEELDQTTAMWWSPDGSKLAYYGFDESKVPDYLLQLEQTKLYSTIDTEAYPKAGEPNPVVDIYVYDVATKKSIKLDIRDGKPFQDDVSGYYAYHVDWTPDSKAVTVNRATRRQNTVDFSACNPDTGKCSTIVRETWPASWVENSPEQHYLKDGKRFIWASERTGFRNYYLYDLSGTLIATLTKHPFEVAGIVKVDEKNNTMYYLARSGDNHMKVQLHRVGLNGKNDKRLTDPTLMHSISAAPDGQRFIDVAQTHDRAPVSRVIDTNGKILSEIATSDVSKYQSLGAQPVELFTFKAADGVTELHGMLHKPINFDPNRKYPVLVSVYGGPATNGASERFTTTSPLTAYGFLVVTLDSRSAAGRGKKFLDAIYQKLGTVEIDDQAAGVQELCKRAYVDCSRVGIFGTSYGGYASLLALLRHPETFSAAASQSPVTDWRHYDTIYTERYMWTPQGNTEGYDAGSALKIADKLKGRLMLYYGSADNNVHPNNSMQLIQSLQRAGKSFELQVGPDRGHSSMNNDRMMEFFIENLVMKGSITS